MNPTMMTAWRAAVRGAQILTSSVIMVVDFRAHGSFFGSGRAGLLTERLAFEGETMAAVHDAVENGVGQGRIVEIGIPMFDRQLTGDQRGLASGASPQSSRISRSVRASCCSRRLKLPSP